MKARANGGRSRKSPRLLVSSAKTMASDATFVGATSDSASIGAFTDDRTQHVMERIVKHWGNRMLSAAFESLLAHWRLQKAHKRVSRVSSAGSQNACAGMLPEDANDASCGRFSRVSSSGSKNARPDAASSGDEADGMVTLRMLREQDQKIKVIDQKLNDILRAINGWPEVERLREQRWAEMERERIKERAAERDLESQREAQRAAERDAELKREQSRVSRLMAEVKMLRAKLGEADSGMSVQPVAKFDPQPRPVQTSPVSSQFHLPTPEDTVVSPADAIRTDPEVNGGFSGIIRLDENEGIPPVSDKSGAHASAEIVFTSPVPARGTSGALERASRAVVMGPTCDSASISTSIPDQTESPEGWWKSVPSTGVGGALQRSARASAVTGAQARADRLIRKVKEEMARSSKQSPVRPSAPSQTTN